VPPTIFTCQECGRTQAPVEACLKVCECGGSIFSTHTEGQEPLKVVEFGGRRGAGMALSPCSPPTLATSPHRRNHAEVEAPCSEARHRPDPQQNKARPRRAKTFAARGCAVIKTPDKTMCADVTPESVREIMKKMKEQRRHDDR
jgi:hypothetical protein